MHFKQSNNVWNDWCLRGVLGTGMSSGGETMMNDWNQQSLAFDKCLMETVQWEKGVSVHKLGLLDGSH